MPDPRDRLGELAFNVREVEAQGKPSEDDDSAYMSRLSACTTNGQDWIVGVRVLSHCIRVTQSLGEPAGHGRQPAEKLWTILGALCDSLPVKEASPIRSGEVVLLTRRNGQQEESIDEI